MRFEASQQINAQTDSVGGVTRHQPGCVAFRNGIRVVLVGSDRRRGGSVSFSTKRQLSPLRCGQFVSAHGRTVGTRALKDFECRRDVCTRGTFGDVFFRGQGREFLCGCHIDELVEHVSFGPGEPA